jgi:hypothetical protein
MQEIINAFDQADKYNRGIKMTGNATNLSILIFSANDLNTPIKRHRIANWVKKKMTQSYVACKSLISLKKINTGL